MMMAAQQGKRNWFAVWVSVAVVVVLVAVTGLVIWMNALAGGEGEAPEAANINAETGAIAVGDGPDTVATYIDFMCPICNQFEQLYGPTIEELVDDGSITLDIHPISILDRASQGTEYSTRSANAMYCVAVADAEASMPFMQAMFENQPSEGTTGLTDDQILEIASAAGVTGIDACVTDQTYAKYVTARTQDTPIAPGNSGIGTPTVAINGEVISLTGDPEVDLVQAISG